MYATNCNIPAHFRWCAHVRYTNNASGVLQFQHAVMFRVHVFYLTPVRKVKLPLRRSFVKIQC